MKDIHIFLFFLVRGDCEPGYFGRNCRGKCIYPYYGEECRGQCDCDEDTCDVSIGCTNVTKGIVSHIQYVLKCTVFTVISNNHYSTLNIEILI